MSKLIQADFHGDIMQFRNDGWFNATVAAAKFGKRPVDWLHTADCVEYISALADRKTNCVFSEQFNKINDLRCSDSAKQAKLLRLVKETGFVKTKSGAAEIGGGTWLHPKLAVIFARWLDVNFAIWCDEQIDQIIRGKPEELDSKRARHQAAITFKTMCTMLEMMRGEEGKETEHYHYANEARLVNFAVFGKFETIDRNSLSFPELDLLARTENKNLILIAKGLDYDTRKQALLEFVDKENMKRIA